MSSDSITLLKAASGKRATKLWTATTIEPYDAGWSFSFQSAKVRGIANLSRSGQTARRDSRRNTPDEGPPHSHTGGSYKPLERSGER